MKVISNIRYSAEPQDFLLNYEDCVSISYSLLDIG